ncbi:MAG: hypothetical protein ABII93_01625 [Chrysiogenia bacterium]
MEKKFEQWDRIAGLIALDRKKALAEFRRHEFVPGDFSERPLQHLFDWKKVKRPAIVATVASLLLVLGLVSFWLLRGTWRNLQPAPEVSVMLSGSFLYGQAGRLDIEDHKTGALHPFNPYFSTCIAAALQRPAAAMESVAPSAAIERGDPGEVQQKLSRVIRENALEHLLTQFREIQDKEA